MSEASQSRFPAFEEDDYLAWLERQQEAGLMPEETADGWEHVRADHQTFFEQIEDISAPFRRVLLAHDAVPEIPGYEQLEEVGRGGMGVVYRGRHAATERWDAIKVIRADRLALLSASRVRGMLDRFHLETRLAARVAHEHIVPVYQVGETSGRPWYSMRYVAGQNLHELCAGQPLPPERAARYLERIARAVGEVHRHGILHVDIKPQNILIDADSDQPLIADFGLAVFEAGDGSGQTACGGTPAYMAPELAQAALQRVASPDELPVARTVACDVYSLGATLWSVLNGTPDLGVGLSARESLLAAAEGRLRVGSDLARDVPEPLRQICLKCLSVDPTQRYASAGELADELHGWLHRPQWNRHFPRLRNLLRWGVAPFLLGSGLLSSVLVEQGASEWSLWSAYFVCYLPLFVAFARSQGHEKEARAARRELWSVWLGHCVAAAVGLFSLRVLVAASTPQLVQVFYVFLGALNTLTFFAKSGNFWRGYRAVGFLWAALTPALALVPGNAPAVFGAGAAATCWLIAGLDRSLREP